MQHRAHGRVGESDMAAAGTASSGQPPGKHALSSNPKSNRKDPVEIPELEGLRNFAGQFTRLKGEGDVWGQESGRRGGMADTGERDKTELQEGLSADRDLERMLQRSLVIV